MEKFEFSLWTPLIGFDVNEPDCGAKKYLEQVGRKPDSIALFVYNADIINLFDKTDDKEFTFPPDYCNYFGSPWNNLTERQSWTNYNLKTLCTALKEEGVETYMSVMGAHLSPEDDDDDTPQVGMHGYVCKQEFVMRHRELAIEGTLEKGYIHLLKHFKDGTSFGDYFIEHAFDAVSWYNMSGLHLSDSIFPHSIQIMFGDYSDDMIGQFVAHTNICLPEKITAPSAGRTTMALRADYIWNNCRKEWIRFIADAWQTFFTKLCARFHLGGKKVYVNNSWTSEPFESLYRFGIDYKGLERAGIDGIYVEDQATVLMMTIPDSRYKIHELMLAPALMKCYSPETKLIAINFAKDSNEECSIIDHNPCGSEREIYKLTAMQYLSKGKVRPAVDGMFICLADAISKSEWKWLNKRFDIAYGDKYASTLSPTFIWSDAFMGENYLDDYLSTRKPSVHRILSEVSRYGGCCSAFARIENLDEVSGTIFVPNIDLLPQDELNRIAKYNRGSVVYTSTADKEVEIGALSAIFYDEAQPVEKFRSCVGVKGTLNVDFDRIKELLKDTSGKIIDGDPLAVTEGHYWTEDLVFNVAGNGFYRAVAELLRGCTQSILTVDGENPATVYKVANGKYRLITENDDVCHYKHIKVHVHGYRIRNIKNVNDFPVHPPKLLYEGDLLRPNIIDDSDTLQAVGFIVKLPACGASIVDLELEKI